MRTLGFGRTIVELHAWGTRVVLPSGAEVLGMPHDDAAYRETAKRLGYGEDVAALNREHEVLHCALAHLLGLPCSPTLSTVAGAPVGDAVLHGLEEDAVMAVQRLARAAGVDVCAAFGGRA